MSNNCCDSPFDVEREGRLFQSLLEKHEHVKVVECSNLVPDDVMVSICIPTYQHVTSIKKCLDSILVQDVGFSYEILLGEDGSTDGTREICLEYAYKNPQNIRLFLHSRENNIKINGQASGRFNILYLLSKANGEFITICEGDDRWTDKNKLCLQIEAMSDAPNCNVSCHPAHAESLRYAKQGGIIGYHGEDKRIIPAADVILSGGGFAATLSFMFRRCIVSHLPEWLISAPVLDYYLLALASLSGGCLYLPMTIGVYGNENPNSWTNRVLSNAQLAVDFENFFREYLDRLADEVGPANIGAVNHLRRQRRINSLYEKHLPWQFRAAEFRAIKPTLSRKCRFSWYMSVFGMFPGLLSSGRAINRYLQRIAAAMR
jgi:glycosyltransferase involved in cell wall biosynthesis